MTVFLVSRPDAQKLQLHEVARLSVEGGEGLVHQQDARIDRQGAGEIDALLHAAGKLMGIVIFKTVQADQVEKLLAICSASLRCFWPRPSRPSRTFFRLVRQGSSDAP